MTAMHKMIATHKADEAKASTKAVPEPKPKLHKQTAKVEQGKPYKSKTKLGQGHVAGVSSQANVSQLAGMMTITRGQEYEDSKE